MISCWPGEERAGALVAVGLQDRSGRHIVALRYDVERVAVPTMIVVPPGAAGRAAAPKRGCTVEVVSMTTGRRG